MIYNRLKKCRICGSRNIKEVLDLGNQSLTGKFPKTVKKKNYQNTFVFIDL